MPYGEITEPMAEAIRKVVTVQTVWDWGSGDGGHSRKLLEWGASKVVAVDKEYSHERTPRRNKNIQWVPHAFQDVTVPTGGFPVSFVCWPLNTETGIQRLLEASKVVIYIGSNVEGNACGTKTLFEHLVRREILAHIPHRRNTLVVYGDVLHKRRPLIGEEIPVFSGVLLPFDEAEGIAGKVEFAHPLASGAF